MLLLFFFIIPVIGIFLCLQCEYFNIKISKWIALLTTLLVFILSICLWWKYIDYNKNVLYHNWYDEFIQSWIPILGINFHLGIDGLSLIMVLLASVLFIFSILCSWNNVIRYSGIFYSSILVIFIGTLGVLLSLDLFLFFCFWEIMLLPMYFLIIFWGDKQYHINDRVYTANKFLIYTQVSSICMLFSILLLSFNAFFYTHIITFDYNTLLNIPIDFSLEYVIMLGFFLAFAVKMPIFPFHSWLPGLHSKTLPSGVLDLSGLLMKVSAYGLLRFNMNLFKHSSMYFMHIAIFLGLLTIFYGSWMAFYETNIKKIISYSSISHMGVILVGIYYCDKLIYPGLILQIIFNTISSAALFILFGQIYHKFKIQNINEMGGLYSKVQWIPGFVLFFLLVNLNFPGTPSFIGEVMILTGILHYSFYIVGFLIFGLLFSVIYSLNIIHKVFYGPYLSNYVKKYNQINCFEFSMIFSLMLLVIISGLFPQYILRVCYTI